MDISLDPGSTAKDINDSLKAMALKDIGVNSMIKLLDRKRKAEEVHDSTYYRLKRGYLDLENKFSRESKYVEELTRKIESVEIQ